MDNNFTTYPPTYPPTYLPTYPPTHIPTNPCRKVLLLEISAPTQEIPHTVWNSMVHHHLVTTFYWIINYIIPFWSLCNMLLNTVWQPERHAPITPAVRWLLQHDDYQGTPALVRKYSCNKLKHICQFSCFLVKESGGGGEKVSEFLSPPQFMTNHLVWKKAVQVKRWHI